MKIYFKRETLEALVKAGVKSAALLDDDNYYHGKDIDSKFIEPADFPIIREIVRKPEHWKLIENRRIVRKLDAIESLQTSGLKKHKIKRLEVLEAAIQSALLPTPHKWMFRLDRTFGILLPYFVTSVKYNPPGESRHGQSPANVTVVMEAVLRGNDDTETIQFTREDLEKGGSTVEEALSSKNAYVETPVLVEAYEADMEEYRAAVRRTGEQYLARGKGRVSGNHRWLRDEINFEREGRPAKVVMDDELGEKKSSGYAVTKFWTEKHSRADDEEGEESYKLPVHPVLCVFNLGTHEYVDCHIGSLEEYQYDSTAASKLVLPDEHKELIDALTGSAIRRMDDIIRGKALGVIIMCSGKPGTGKTLTAEVYSEAAKRPLYTVQCSQLGTNEEHLEKKLAEVLERATRWRAILLIDEADVYVHERGADIQQNAIVGVFLRLLEYYNGILFLTTNRATIIDDAILSRATAHVKYDVPIDDTRKRLWRVLADQYGASDLDIDAAIKEFPKVSGRSIRQLIRLSRIMADRQKKPVTVELLKWAAKFHDFTELDE